MNDNDFGERTHDDTLRFERAFAAPVERVWRAIITPGELAVWIGRATVEPTPGGRFEIDFDEESRMNGRVVAYEPPRLLEIAWHETLAGVASQHSTRPNDESIVRFELSPTLTGGTTLVFTHRFIRAGERMLGFGAGWHAHLNALAALLSNAPSPDREALYERLRASYESRLERTPEYLLRSPAVCLNARGSLNRR